MNEPILLSRRHYLQTMLAAGALALAGCKNTQICPDPSEATDINWVPDILHPLFWGFQDLDVATGAPGPMRIYYPTYEGSPQNAPILKLCWIRYPVVLFMHGQPPCTDATYYQRWQCLGMVLARSGYVVVMPKHPALNPNAGTPSIDVGLAALDFVRNTWEHRNWVDADAKATAVGGHSWGSMIAARIRQARPTISGFFGLSGPWTEVTDTIALLQSIDVPAFFSWQTQVGSESLDPGGLWQAIPGPKWAAIFEGLHFDYLGRFTQCSFPRGSCDLIEPVMAELVALFLSGQVPIKGNDAALPPSLIPPTVVLTNKQQFFAGGHLSGIAQIQSRQGCGIDLRWEGSLGNGSRHLGP
jgi:pimeloyl-ACP methyl ester carboxylesterase